MTALVTVYRIEVTIMCNVVQNATDNWRLCPWAVC